MRRGLVAAAAVLLATATPAAAARPHASTIVNGDAHGATMRFDVDGNAIDAHDGEIQRFGNRYFLYGTTDGCGFEWQRPGSPFCGFRAYSSRELDAAGRGKVRYERTAAAGELSWSPSELALEPDIAVERGHRYAIVLLAPAAATGSYGLAYSDADPYPRGGALYSSDGGASWRPEPDRDLKFETSVKEIR